MNLWLSSRFNYLTLIVLTMANVPRSISLDERLWAILDAEAGREALSSYLGYFLGIFFGPDQPTYRQLEAYRKRMGYRDVAEVVKALMIECMDQKMKPK